MARKIRFSTRLRKSGSKVGKFLKGKKGYAVAALSLCAVGIASVLIFDGSAEDGKTPQVQQVETYAAPTADAVKSVSGSEDESLIEAANTALKGTQLPKSTPIADFTAAPQTPAAVREKLIAPVEGEIIWGYAVDSLIYSRTLSQWMTHSGVDIASAKDSEVHAVAGGCVENVYTDDLLGVCVVIVHDDDTMSVYANLKEEPPVKEGQLVEKRDVIGFVGDSAISECGIESHLHFEFFKGDKNVDPEEYVRFEKTDIE